MTGRLSTYRSLNKHEKKLFWEALRKIYWCKFLLIFNSFKKLTVKFAATGKNDAPTEDLIIIRRAINRASGLAFWRNKCLVNTLCARWMLNNRDIKSEAYLGVKLEEGNTKAHAWIVAGDTKLVHEDQTYKVVYTF